MKSMSPLEYEVFFTLVQLRQNGVNEALFKDICTEINRKREQEKEPLLTVQHIHYYVKRLTFRPFIQKRNSNGVTHYSLKHGLWKLPQKPPLCIKITADKTILMHCVRVKECSEEPSANCLPTQFIPKRMVRKMTIESQ